MDMRSCARRCMWNNDFAIFLAEKAHPQCCEHVWPRAFDASLVSFKPPFSAVELTINGPTFEEQTCGRDVEV